MEELKQFVEAHPHIQTVYFDTHGNWFLHKGRTVVKEMTRAEVLEAGPEATEEVAEVKKKKK